MKRVVVLMTEEEKEKINKASKEEKRSMSSYLLMSALEKIEQGDEAK